MGNCSLSHIVVINLYILCFSSLPPYIINSGIMLSVPPAFPPFNLLIMEHTSLKEAPGFLCPVDHSDDLAVSCGNQVNPPLRGSKGSYDATMEGAKTASVRLD